MGCVVGWFVLNWVAGVSLPVMVRILVFLMRCTEDEFEVQIEVKDPAVSYAI
jgi:hypothetical protein